jgi:hypothetical protein
MIRRRFFLCAVAMVMLGASTAKGRAILVASDRQGRRRLAQGLRDDFHRLEGAIPNLSPAEAAFVEREEREAFAASGGRYNERVFRLRDGREYNIREARAWAVFIVGSLNEVLRETEVRREIATWSRIAWALTDISSAQSAYALMNLKVLDGKSLPFPSNDFGIFSANAAQTAHTIIENFVTPYLEGSLR